VKHKVELADIDGYDSLKFIIEVDEINDAVIDQLPQYLIDHIDEAFLKKAKLEKKDRDLYDLCLPVFILVNSRYWLSERILWAMVIETRNAGPLIDEYMEKICQLSGKEELPWSDSENPLGSAPLLESLNRDSSGKDILGAFCKFLLKCDMQHAVWQDHYIKKIFSDNVESDLSYLFYISVYKNTGWDWPPFVEKKEMLSFTLNHQAPLKGVIDYLLADDDEEIKTDASIYQFLACAAYGDDEDKIKTVADYVKKKLDEQDLKLNGDEPRYKKAEIAEVRERAIGDMKTTHPDVELNSGFYIRKKRKWKALPL
jgi:hypothetical protein